MWHYWAWRWCLPGSTFQLAGINNLSWPAHGGLTGGLYLPNQSQSSLHSDLDLGVKVHSDPYGKRCISVAAFALPKTDFRKIFGAEQSAHESQGTRARIHRALRPVRMRATASRETTNTSSRRKIVQPNDKIKGMLLMVRKAAFRSTYLHMDVSRRAWA